MKTVTVVATFEARPGKEIELRNALVGLVAPTRQEAGCLNYDLHVAPENPAKFLFHENWTTKAALDTHLQTPTSRRCCRASGNFAPSRPPS
jgi:quinol monooxygenase YgiN